MFPNCIDTFILNILSVLVGKFEFGSECGFFQADRLNGFLFLEKILNQFYRFGQF